MICNKTPFCDLIANLFDYCSIYHSPTMSKDKGLWVCVATKPNCWVCPRWCTSYQNTNGNCPTCRLPHLEVHPSHNETEDFWLCSVQCQPDKNIFEAAEGRNKMACQISKQGCFSFPPLLHSSEASLGWDAHFLNTVCRTGNTNSECLPSMSDHTVRPFLS